MKKRMKQMLSMLLAVCMTVMMLPTGAFALEAAPVADSGLCAHHTEHTAECGYVAAVEGSPCNHVHDESCGYVAAVAEISCNMDCTDTDGDGIIDHAEGCAYAPAVDEQPCTHVHNETCGYVEAVEGVPCTFVCTECAKEIKPTNGDAATLSEAQQAFVDAVSALDKDTLTALADAYKADPTGGGEAETAFYAEYDKVEGVDGSAAELYAALTPDEQAEETVAASKATLDEIISAVNATLAVETQAAADVPALYTAGNGLALQLGTSGVADKDFVYFGNYKSENIKWKVLDADADNTGKANGMFLLSEYLLEQSNVPFDADKIKNEGQYDPNKWQHSDAQAWCTAFAASSAFTTSEKTALKTVSKEDSATTKYGIAYGTSSLVDEKVFYLSAEEAATYISSNNFDKGLAAGSSGGIEGAWWLRSPNPNYTVMVGFVNEDGFVNSTDVAYTKVGVRPAFNLDTSKVLFSSAATDGKASGTVGAGALNSVPEYTDTTKDWKVTLLDTSRQGFTAQAAESAATSKDVGYESWSVDIAYSNANKGTNEYVSAMLCDADGNVFYYGNIAQNSASGTQTVNIPTGLGIGNYTLKVFSEQLTGDNKPDYASTMQDIALTVTGSVIEPVTPVPVIQFGTSDVADKGFVYFGKYNSTDIKWKVLDADKTNTNEDGMFLLSEYLLEQSNVPFDADNNVWQGSDAQAWCTSFATSNAFTDAEKIALKGVAKTDVATNKYSLDWGTSELTAADDKVFYLSAEEAANYIGPNNSDEGLATTTSGGAAGYWWLRSPDYSNPDTRTLLAGFVNEDGCVLLTSVDFTDPGVRPAFNLDTSKILFTSLTGGKSATGMDTALTAVPIATPSEWTLTLSDSARSTFTAETTGKIGDVLTVSYTGATTGDNEYISAVVKAADGAIKYYGRVAAVSNAEGSATINLSGITMADSDTLCVFNEQYNGDNKTDYASELRAVSLTAPPVPVIQLGTSGVVDKNFVYFGKYNSTDIKWKVLDADKTNTNEDGMFLLSEYLLEQSNVSFDADSNVWQGSDAQAWCTAFAGSDAFTTSEKSALKSVSKNDAQTWQYNWNWGTSSLSNEKVFYLSAEEAATYIGSNNGAKGLATTTSGGTAGYWWLRSPYYNYTYLAGCVVEDGDVDRNGVDDSYTDVRPAFNLDISKVLFTSLTGGKSTTGMDTALTAVPIATPSEWTLTLSDSARSAFTAETTEKAGDVLTVSYTGATTGDNEYISAVVKAADGAIKYYGRVAQVTNAEGNANINLSGITMADGDTLCVFNEQYNGDNKTDYASELKDVSLTVIPLPDLTVTGGTKDTDYTYADGVLTVLTSVPLTIANRNVNIATTDRIVVANGKTANLTLNGVTIETLGNAAAITVKNAADTKLNLTLAMGSTNTLKGADNYAGIDVTGDAALTIDGTGTLDVTGGAYSAGIGGGSGAGSNGIITINSGTVIASGGEFGSGIGNGTGGGAGIDTAKTITINGGTVTANGIYSGAGIGCGGSGSNGTIIINSGIVTANGGITGVDIGSTGGDSTITITGGSFAVGDTTANTVYGNAVASGYCVKNIGGSCPYTVVKLADVTITPTTDENKLSQTYAETTFDATKLFTFDENCGTATYSLASGGTGEGSITKEGVLTVTKAGTFKIQVDTAAHDGYAAGSESVTLTVKKAANSCTGPVIMNDYTYGGAVSGPAIIEYEGPATYYYNTSDDNTGGTEWKGITPTTLNANDYWIYATVAGDDLHNDFISSAKKFTVRRATPTVELTAKETAYTGNSISANTATVTLIDSEIYTGAITYKYYTDIDCTKGETETAPTTAGSYYVKASIAAAGNYTSAVSAAVKLEITQATAVDVTTPTTAPVTYSATGKLSDTKLASGWEWADGSIIPTVGNSGYTAYYAVSDYTNYDWNDIDGYDSTNHRVERTVSLTVNPAAAADVTAPTTTPVTYSADGKLSDTNLASGWEWAKPNTVPTVGNSGYTAYYAVSDYTNYDWNDIDGYNSTNHRVERTVSLTVNPATAANVTTPTTTAVTYSATGKLSDTKLASGWEWAKPNTVPTVGNSGYTAYYAVSDDTNYDWSKVVGYDKDNHRVERTVALMVNPETAADVTTPTTTAVTYSTTGKLSDTKLASGWEWAKPNTVPTVGNSGYTAYYAVSDDTNYDWSKVVGYDKDNHRVERTVTLTVNPAQVTALELSSLVTAPVKNAIPTTAITGQTEYSGTVTWNDGPEKFLGNTIYIATITLTPTDNYTFNGVEENAFTYTGATDATSTAPDASGKVTVTIVFPATDNRTVSELITSGNLTKTIYNIGESFDSTGLTITVKYDDDTSEVITATTAGYSVNPTTMAADTTSVTVGFGGKNTSSIAVTVRENLTSIAPVSAITELPNGTAKTATALGLPSAVSIVTSTGKTTTANITWNAADADYDPASLDAKNFTVNGTVELPTDMSNLSSVPLTTQMNVSVKAATLTTKPEQNTNPGSTDTAEKITGIKVGDKVTVGSTLTITADEFIRGDKTYIPVAWATNPSGSFTRSSGTTYTATVDTTGMTTGAHTFTITYREVATDNRAATGNTVQTMIDYTIKAASNSDDDDGSATNYIITTDAGKGGSFDTGKTVSVKAGESARFNIKSDSGYVIADVLVDGRSVGAISYYEFTNVQANHTISAIFEVADTDVNPSTGDNSNMVWWIALLFISGGAVTVLGISKKRKYTLKH